MKIGKYLILIGLCISLLTGCQDKDEQREPRVQTFNANDASDYSIKLNGIVEHDNGGLVTERGFCWSALPNVNLSDSIVFSGNGLGMYSARLEGLPKSKTFYFRAFATNSGGTSYGEEYSFKAEEIPHQIEIINVGFGQLSGIATIYYHLTEGSQSPISHGICYGLEPSPTINNTVKEISSSHGGGWVQIDDLEPDNIYYFRIYVRYFTGVQYSEDVKIITYELGPTLEIKEGPGYVSSDTTIAINTSITVGVIGHADGVSDNKLSRFNFWIEGNSGTAFVDSTFSSLDFFYDKTLLFQSPRVNTLFFKLWDEAGLNVFRKLEITVIEAGPGKN